MYVKSYTYGILGGLLSGLCTQTLAQKTPKLNFGIAMLDEPLPRSQMAFPEEPCALEPKVLSQSAFAASGRVL